MTTRSLTLDLPHSVAHELDSLSREMVAEILSRGLREWRIERALERYRSGEQSFAAAAEQSRVPRSDLARHAYARGVEPPFSPETLAEELA